MCIYKELLCWKWRTVLWCEQFPCVVHGTSTNKLKKRKGNVKQNAPSLNRIEWVSDGGPVRAAGNYDNSRAGLE